MRCRKWERGRKSEKKCEKKKKKKEGGVCPTWIGVVVEEEEEDGEGDGAGKDASEALDIPETTLTLALN